MKKAIEAALKKVRERRKELADIDNDIVKLKGKIKLREARAYLDIKSELQSKGEKATEKEVSNRVLLLLEDDYKELTKLQAKREWQSAVYENAVDELKSLRALATYIAAVEGGQ